MKAVKIIFNILGILLAIFLSIALVLVLIATPAVSVTTSLMEPETLHTVIKEVDYEEIITSNPEVSETLAEYGMDAETITAIMESDAVEAAMQLYMEDVFAAIDGTFEASQLTPEAIKQIAYDHMDEIVEIAKEYKDPEEEVNDQEIEAQIRQVVEEYADEVAELVPDPVELGLTDFEDASEDTVIMVQTVKELRSGRITMALLIVAIILSILIILCRIMRFKGFMWIGVVYTVAAMFCFSVSMLLKNMEWMYLLEMDGWMSTLVDSATGVLGGQMLTRALVLFGIALASVAIFVVGRILFVRKKKEEV